MAVIELLILLVILAFSLFAIDQIIVPAWKGLPLFPTFRRKRQDLEKELSRAKEEVQTAEIEDAIKRERKKSDSIKNRISKGKGETGRPAPG